MFEELKKSFLDYLLLSPNCSFGDWEWLEKKTIKVGMLAKLFYYCKECKHEASAWTKPTEDDTYMDINTAVVSSVFYVGTGYQQMNKVFFFFFCNATSYVAQ